MPVHVRPDQRREFARVIKDVLSPDSGVRGPAALVAERFANLSFSSIKAFIGAYHATLLLTDYRPEKKAAKYLSTILDFIVDGTNGAHVGRTYMAAINDNLSEVCPYPDGITEYWQMGMEQSRLYAEQWQGALGNMILYNSHQWFSEDAIEQLQRVLIPDTGWHPCARHGEFTYFWDEQSYSGSGFLPLDPTDVFGSGVNLFMRTGQGTRRIHSTTPATPALLTPPMSEHRHSAQIQSYNYRPHRLHRYGPRNGGPCIGFELEVECVDNRDLYSRRFTDWRRYKIANGFFYLKHDGSLYNGFEAVSEPFNWPFYKANKDKFTDMMKLTLRSMQITERCGLHIHIGATALSNLELYKMGMLLYNNKTKMRTLSRRSNSALERYATLDVRHNNYRSHAIHRNSEKYLALRMSPSTAELRFFAGPRTPDEFHTSVQFAFAATDFVHTHGLRDMTFEAMTSYVDSHNRQYPELAAAMLAV